jgi:hypothetical protein
MNAEFKEWLDTVKYDNSNILSPQGLAWEAWQASSEQLTSVTEQRDSIDSMYYKIIKEVLECDPIPACKRKDDQLEPPWEVIARVREQRDELQQWKNDQMTVNSEWDMQTVGELLGLRIGEGITLNIEPKIRELINQRDRLAEAVNAATILIAAKGRHNTMLAYNGLRDALQSITNPNEL